MKKNISNDWRTQAETFVLAAQRNYEQAQQRFLELFADSPQAAIEQQGSTLLQAQVIHQQMEIVHVLLNEASTIQQARQVVLRWITSETVETVAAFSRSFTSDLTGVCQETAISFRLQFLQMANSPLNRLLKILL